MLLLWRGPWEEHGRLHKPLPRQVVQVGADDEDRDGQGIGQGEDQEVERIYGLVEGRDELSAHQ